MVVAERSSPSNRLIPGIREYVIELVRSRYADFGASLGAEVLFEKDGVKVSRETLRRRMSQRETNVHRPEAAARMYQVIYT